MVPFFILVLLYFFQIFKAFGRIFNSCLNEKYIEKLLRWLIFQEARKNTSCGNKNKTKDGKDGIGIKFYF